MRIEIDRVSAAPVLHAVVVAIDPPRGSYGVSAVVGCDSWGSFYVIGTSGDKDLVKWARRAGELAAEYKAQYLVMETDTDDDVAGVRMLLDRTSGKGSLPGDFWGRPVARTGPPRRVSPFRDAVIAESYESGNVRHVGVHSDLEAQLASFEPGNRNSMPELVKVVDLALYALANPPCETPHIRT